MGRTKVTAGRGKGIVISTPPRSESSEDSGDDYVEEMEEEEEIQEEQLFGPGAEEGGRAKRKKKDSEELEADKKKNWIASIDARPGVIDGAVANEIKWTNDVDDELDSDDDDWIATCRW